MFNIHEFCISSDRACIIQSLKHGIEMSLFVAFKYSHYFSISIPSDLFYDSVPAVPLVGCRPPPVCCRTLPSSSSAGSRPRPCSSSPPRASRSSAPRFSRRTRSSACSAARCPCGRFTRASRRTRARAPPTSFATRRPVCSSRRTSARAVRQCGCFLLDGDEAVIIGGRDWQWPGVLVSLCVSWLCLHIVSDLSIRIDREYC